MMDIEFYKKIISIAKEEWASLEASMSIADKISDYLLSRNKKVIPEQVVVESKTIWIPFEENSSNVVHNSIAPYYFDNGLVMFNGKVAKPGTLLPGWFVASDGTFTPDLLTRWITQIPQ